MERRFHEELKRLKQNLLKMGLAAEGALEKAVGAFLDQNRKLAVEVLQGEKLINSFEIEIDEKGHALLALSQPMAIDMRSITAILKINADLERMGDHAVNIAERALKPVEPHRLGLEEDLKEMAHLTQKVLKDSLVCFVRENVELARSVLERDDVIDSCYDHLSAELTLLMEQQPLAVQSGINMLIVAHNLERIADLANNIAEDVVYMKEGKEVRHHLETQL